MKRRFLAAFLAAGLVAVLAPAAGASTPAGTISIPAGHGSSLVVHRDPFQLSLVDAHGRTTVATTAGRNGLPVQPPFLDGVPEPLDPLGAVGGFPAIGWVVGANVGTAIPIPPFQGNRLFGADTGVLVAVTRVRRAERIGNKLKLTVGTTAPLFGPAHLTLTTLPAGGVRIDARPPKLLPAVSSMFSLASPAGEGLYGLGARKDSFDQRGKLRNVWTAQENLGAGKLSPIADLLFGPDYTFPNGAQAAYFVQAALFGSRGWGAWVYGSMLSRLDLAHSRNDTVRWGVARRHLVFALAGGGLGRASRSFTAVDGRAPAPPPWVYQPWIDVINEGEGAAAPNGTGFSGGARVKRDARSIAAHARSDHLPIGVIGMEGWQSVPGIATLTERLRAEGFHLSAYWNFFTGRHSPAARPARRQGLFVTLGPTRLPFPVLTDRHSFVHILDFTNPKTRGYWVDQVARSCRLGFAGWMEDYGELVSQGMGFHSRQPWYRVHNRYPVDYHADGRAAAQACARKHPGMRPFFYVRSGYSMPSVGSPGTAAYTSSVFPGDETTDWSKASGLPSVVPAMLNLALGGMYTFTTDVGGYLDLLSPRTTPQLLARWSELAAFTPVMRIHDSTENGSLYPWQAGKRVEDIYRRYARAKVKLAPLVDRISRRAAATGEVGPVRPLVLDDPSPAARSVDDEWLLGHDLLVAPVLRKDATSRSVYLPASARWQPLRVAADGSLKPYGEPVAGGRRITAHAPLGVVPLYRRVGR